MFANQKPACLTKSKGFISGHDVLNKGTKTNCILLEIEQITLNSNNDMKLLALGNLG